MKHLFSILALTVMIAVFVSCGSSSSGGGCTQDGKGSKLMFFSANKTAGSISITDDLLSLSDGATAVPRVIKGANTTIGDFGTNMDNIVVDHMKKEIYVADSGTGNILVFADAKTAIGNIAPSRTISFGMKNATALEMDVCKDILYVTGIPNGESVRHIWSLANAGTLSGTVVPEVDISSVPGAYSLSLDTVRDRLYVGGYFNQAVYIFNSASTITSASTYDVIFFWVSGVSGFSGPSQVWADGKTDRLYLSSNGATLAGNYIVALEDASTLTTATTVGINLDDDSSMRIKNEALAIMIDPLDNLYLWPFSPTPTAVQIYHDASLLSGDVSASPDLTINDVTIGGVGMHYMRY